MADESQVIRAIDWQATFPFTLIFRSFRVAVHPSKLALALLALIAIWVGGSLLDALTPVRFRAVANEPAIYQNVRESNETGNGFVFARDEQAKADRDLVDSQLEAIGKKGGSLKDIHYALLKKRDENIDQARKQFDTQAASAKPEERKTLEETRDKQIVAISQSTSTQWRTYRNAANRQGLFESFSDYELSKLYGAFDAGSNFHFLGSNGVLEQLFEMIWIGPAWAFGYHPIFFTILILYLLVVWAVAGGAISRIAAVQVARDEKISFWQALTFSTNKFLSFVSAPIIPLLIVAAVGLFITAYTLVTFNIPFIGPIIGGALFVLPLVAGFVLTLVLIGLVCGFNLMYPTIAVEGSDSFDAISRSFSYVYARPWRMAFYTLAAAVYGAITYLFVRFFITLLLLATHAFASAGVFRHALNTEPVWGVIWPHPLAAERLSYSIDWMTLSVGDRIGAGLVAFWVYLLVAMLGAYAISFYFSASTIIYGLMRHEVDATELDDVYLEPTDDEFADTPGTATVANEAVPLPPAGDAPPTP